MVASAFSAQQARRLEIQHNVEALDPESLIPWVMEVDQADTSERLYRAGVVFGLGRMMIDSIRDDHPDDWRSKPWIDQINYLRWDVISVAGDVADYIKIGR